MMFSACFEKIKKKFVNMGVLLKYYLKINDDGREVKVGMIIDDM